MMKTSRSLLSLLFSCLLGGAIVLTLMMLSFAAMIGAILLSMRIA